mgnify:CR=1 FL=1|jgi:hypothetical protein
MEKEAHNDESLLSSRWFTFGMLTAATLLISPTFTLGFLASSLARTLICGLTAAIYAAIFHIIFENQAPVGIESVTEAYRSLALCTVIAGSAVPFIAGWIFRVSWKARKAKEAVILAVASFGILAGGSYLVTQRTDALSAASNTAVGRSQALAILESEAASIGSRHPGSPEAKAARFLASKVASEILGVRGPASLDDFTQIIKDISPSVDNGEVKE